MVQVLLSNISNSIHQILLSNLIFVICLPIVKLFEVLLSMLLFNINNVFVQYNYVDKKKLPY